MKRTSKTQHKTRGLWSGFVLLVALQGCDRPAPIKEQTDKTAQTEAHGREAPKSDATGNQTAAAAEGDRGKDKDGDHGGRTDAERDGGKEKPEASGLSLSAEEIKSAGIRIQVLKPEGVRSLVVVAGTIAPDATHLARMAPQVAGRLERMTAVVGAAVHAGQVLATLQSPEVESLRSAWRTAATDLGLATAHFERMDGLYRDQVIARKDWLNAQADLERARAAADSARSRLRLLGVSTDSTDNTYALTAPFAGTVTDVSAVQGELASPDKPVLTIADLSSVWVEAELHEQELGEVQTGALADVTVAAYPGRVFAGRMTYIDSSLDAQTHTVKARIEVRNPGQVLKIGMLASVSFAGRTMVSGLAVPADAVVLINGQATVFRQEGQRFEPVPVTTGARTSGRVVILSGVKAGEEIVTAGAYPLKARLMKSSIGDAD